MTFEGLLNMTIDIGLNELKKIEEIAQKMAEEKDIDGLIAVIKKLSDLNRMQLENQRREVKRC